MIDINDCCAAIRDVREHIRGNSIVENRLSHLGRLLLDTAKLANAQREEIERLTFELSTTKELLEQCRSRNL